MQEFKLIVAGGRDFNDYERAKAEILRLANGELAAYAVSIVSGMAKGADLRAVWFAKEHNIKLHEFPADWDRYGKAAGFIRNHAMGDFADGLLAFWDGKSRGTADMIAYMKHKQKPVRTVSYGVIAAREMAIEMAALTV